MKSLLLLLVGVFICVALFGDGGLEVSPSLSTDLAAQLEFSPSVSYAPQTTNVETQANTYIDTNVEQQTVIVQPSINGGWTGGSTVVSIPPDQVVPCTPLANEIITTHGGNGECTLQNTVTGQKWFVNPRGVRWPLCQSIKCDEPIVPPVASVANGEPVGLYSLKPAATPLAAAPAELSLEQLQAAFLRNGGELPWLWDARNERAKMDWLKEQAATWR